MNGRSVSSSGELIEDGKAYARAELDLAKASAEAKGQGAGDAGGAVRGRLHLHAGRRRRACVGVAIALATLIGPLGGRFRRHAVFAGIAGLLGWLGIRS